MEGKRAGGGGRRDCSDDNPHAFVDLVAAVAIVAVAVVVMVLAMPEGSTTIKNNSEGEPERPLKRY